MMKLKNIINTGGDGLWSREIRKVQLSKMSLAFASPSFADLNVFFTKKSWDTYKHGLIYTDRRWLKEFRQLLVTLGFTAKASRDVDYSEQGMQGDNFVSLDVGKHFIKEYIAKSKSNKLEITEEDYE